MKAIEPGDRFTVRYGNDREIEVVALSGRGKRKLLGLLGEVKTLDKTPEGAARVYEIAEELLKLCVPGVTDEVIETMNETHQFEIANATIAEQMLTEDDRKKSE